MNTSQYIEFVNELTNNYFGSVTRHDEFPSPLSDTFNRIVQYCPLIFGRATATPSIECHDNRIYISGASSGNPTSAEQVNLYHLCAGTMSDYIKAITVNSPSVSPTTTTTMSSTISSVVPTGAPVYLESNVTPNLVVESSTPTTSTPLSAEPTVDLISSADLSPVTNDTPPSVVVSPSNTFIMAPSSPPSSTRSRGNIPIIAGGPSINPTVNPSRIKIHEIKFRLAFRKSIAIDEASFIANKNGVQDYIRSAYKTFAENVADIFNKRTTILVGGGLENRRLESQVVSGGEDRVMLEKIKLKSILRHACPNKHISDYNCLEIIGVIEYAVEDEDANTAREFNNRLDISYERGDLTILIEDDGGIYKIFDDEENSFASSAIAGIAAAGVAGAGILVALGAKVRTLSRTRTSRTHTSMSFTRPPNGELDDNEELQEEGDIEKV